MLDQYHPCIQDSIENIIDVKADGNCGGVFHVSPPWVERHVHDQIEVVGFQ